MHRLHRLLRRSCSVLIRRLQVLFVDDGSENLRLDNYSRDRIRKTPFVTVLQYWFVILESFKVISSIGVPGYVNRKDDR